MCQTVYHDLFCLSEKLEATPFPTRGGIGWVISQGSTWRTTRQQDSQPWHLQLLGPENSLSRGLACALSACVLAATSNAHLSRQLRESRDIAKCLVGGKTTLSWEPLLYSQEKQHFLIPWEMLTVWCWLKKKKTLFVFSAILIHKIESS